jgi:hypothetical protein
MSRPTVVGRVGELELDARIEADDELELEPEADSDSPAGSVLAQMRVAAEAQRRAHTLELEVGGALDRLVIRYRVLTPREWDKYAVLLTPQIAARGAGTGDLPPMSVLNARMMAAACETCLWRGDDGELSDLEVRLDGRLAEMLGHPLPAGMTYSDLGVLEVVDGLFASPMAVTAHAGELVQWMQNPTDTGGDEPGEA